MSPKMIGKVYGDKWYSYHRRIKKDSKKLNARMVRRRLNRDLDL
jgi:hypothetical protein